MSVFIEQGREKKIYAIPPHTRSCRWRLTMPFEIEHMEGRQRRLWSGKCLFDELIDRETGAVSYQCSDTVTALNEIPARRRTADAY